MSLPLIILRPQPGCAATLAAARAAGLDAHGFPLFTAEARRWDAPDPVTIDALLIGSANAIRLAGSGPSGPALAKYAGKPTYAVGAATAEACRAAGLDVITVGSGGLQCLMGDLDPRHRHLLRLGARDRVPLVPPDHVIITEREVYTSEAMPLPGPLALLLTARALKGAVVMLHSARAASHFAAECARLDIPRHRLHLAALAPRIAAAAKKGIAGGEGITADEGWASLATAATPDDPALLALAGQMCH